MEHNRRTLTLFPDLPIPESQRVEENKAAENKRMNDVFIGLPGAETEPQRGSAATPKNLDKGKGKVQETSKPSKDDLAIQAFLRANQGPVIGSNFPIREVGSKRPRQGPKNYSTVKSLKLELESERANSDTLTKQLTIVQEALKSEEAKVLAAKERNQKLKAIIAELNESRDAAIAAALSSALEDYKRSQDKTEDTTEKTPEEEMADSLQGEPQEEDKKDIAN